MTSSPTVSVAIMAHPRRAKNVRALRRKIGPAAVVVWDRHNDVWDTGRRALLAHNPKATHHLVVQDDAIVPRHLIEGCRRMLRHVPADVPVSLYMGRTRSSSPAERFKMAPVLAAARRRRASFAVFEGPWWGPGIIVPTALVGEIVAYGDARVDVPQYDHKIAYWAQHRGVSCWYTLPSLVEHVHDHTARSLLDHGNGAGRRALWFLGAARSAGAHPWSGRHVTVRDLPRAVRRRFPTTPTYG